MKMTFVLIGALIAGVLTGVVLPQVNNPLLENSAMYILYALLFFVGIDIGFANKKSGLAFFLLMLKSAAFVIVGTIVGSLVGGALAALVLNMGINEGLAIASGFTWYSLSGVLLSQIGSPELGAVAFMSNVFREAFVFLFVPYLCSKKFYEGSISIAAASSMDVSLTVISKYVDSNTAAVSFVHGLLFTAIVPVMVPAMYFLN